jgi:hypothetical protein
MNMFGLSSNVHFAHIAYYWKFFLLHYTQVLCQFRLYRADHAYLTYLMIQRQLSHLNGRKLDLLQAIFSSFLIDLRHGPRTKHRPYYCSVSSSRCVATIIAWTTENTASSIVLHFFSTRSVKKWSVKCRLYVCMYACMYFFNSNSGGWSPTGSTRHVGHQVAYCTCPGWLWGLRICW